MATAAADVETKEALVKIHRLGLLRRRVLRALSLLRGESPLRGWSRVPAWNRDRAPKKMATVADAETSGINGPTHQPSQLLKQLLRGTSRRRLLPNRRVAVDRREAKEKTRERRTTIPSSSQKARPSIV